MAACEFGGGNRRTADQLLEGLGHAVVAVVAMQLCHRDQVCDQMRRQFRITCLCTFTVISLMPSSSVRWRAQLVPISSRLDLNTLMMVGLLDDGIDRHLGMGRLRSAMAEECGLRQEPD